MGTIWVTYEEMQQVFTDKLTRHGLSPERAGKLADILARNSLDGVESHGWNRFHLVIDWIKRGHIQVNAEPECVVALGAWEQWDGNLGPGPLNAAAATRRAMELADQYGMGCVGLRNTNHWMRGGTYGQQAARAGYALICWTNALATIPPYGSRDIRLGNNPLVIAVPRKDGPVVVDMAMSQFSFGKLEVYRRRGDPLPVPGGVDRDGQPTRDAREIIEHGRAFPIGYWKGSGLALLLDITAVLFSGGQATHQIHPEAEKAISQVFIAFDVSRPEGAAWVAEHVQAILDDFKKASPGGPGGEILFPGERVLKTRAKNLAEGIPVDEVVWQAILDG